MNLLFRVKIQSEQDVYLAIYRSIIETKDMNFGGVRLAKLKTAIAELGSNIVKYASSGYISLFSITEPRKGITVIASDKGPGISNIEDAMKDHFSTSGTLGLGLPGVKRLMDVFSITSESGKGTEVIITLYES